MNQRAKPQLDTLPVPEMGHSLIASYRRHLRAAGRDPDTIAHYVGATEQFLHFARDEHLPDLPDCSREHVELWLEGLFERYRPATVHNRLRGLRSFYDWLADEGEIAHSPFGERGRRRIRPPELPESPKDVVPAEVVARLLAALDRQKRWRDALVVALLYDTGMRNSELAGLRAEDVDLDRGLITVRGPADQLGVRRTKSRRDRVVRLSPPAARYLDRYWRRPRPAPELAINGRKGALSRSGLYQIVRRLFEEIGYAGATVGPHDLRHTSATHSTLAGMDESSLMDLFGWRSREMPRHYAEQARQAAALAAHEHASPLQRLGRS